MKMMITAQRRSFSTTNAFHLFWLKSAQSAIGFHQRSKF